MYPHDLRCPTNVGAPEPVGIDDRSGFKLRLDDMPFQYDWRGNIFANVRIRTGVQDVPFEQNRPVIIPPDPVPPRDPRPYQYAAQMQGASAPSGTVQQIPPDF